MTASDKRSNVIAWYKKILGRNKYSQSLRSYCYSPYKDGKYYSDCSSSVSYAYSKSGNSFGILNTVGMYQSKQMITVPVVISKGIIQNPEVLRVGDMLLFAGNDSGRAYAGYVGHVEMVAIIKPTAITIYGHGSGTPRATEMNAYCKKRFNTKTSTKLGNRGLIRVIRFIQDDDVPKDDGNKLRVKPGTWNLRSGPGVEYPKVTVVNGGTILDIITDTEWYFVRVGGVEGYISPKAVERM